MPKGLLLFLTIVLAGCNRSCTEGWKVDFGPTRLQLLVLKMESQYTRSLDQDDFTLHYRSKDPDTVVITVQYTTKTDQETMYRVIESAKDTVKGIGRDSFKLQSVKIEIEKAKISEENP